MWLSAVQLTIVGMATTFIFLILMVWLIQLLGLIINKYFPEKSLEEDSIDEDILIAVIAAAVTSNK